MGAICFLMHRECLHCVTMVPERFGEYTDYIADNRRVQRYTELVKYSVITFVIYLLIQGPYLHCIVFALHCICIASINTMHCIVARNTLKYLYVVCSNRIFLRYY